MVSIPQVSLLKPCIHLPRPYICYMPPHLILDLITWTILVEEYRSLSSSLCSFLHSRVTPSLLSSNILLSTVFSQTPSIYVSPSVWDTKRPKLRTQIRKKRSTYATQVTSHVSTSSGNKRRIKIHNLTCYFVWQCILVRVHTPSQVAGHFAVLSPDYIVGVLFGTLFKTFSLNTSGLR